MKINLNFLRARLGMALLVTLILIGILTLSIAGYLSFLQQQSVFGARGQNWNLALAISEAGIEEALQHLNSCDGVGLSKDSWQQNGMLYTMTRTLSDGSTYEVTIDDTDARHPVITSHGYVSPPLAQVTSPGPFFAAVGVNAPKAISRTVEVVAFKNNFFDPNAPPNPVKDGIDGKGNNVVFDSYDSTDPAKSTNGAYDPAKAGDHGDISSNVGLVNIGNAWVYGQVHVSPDSGGVQVGTQGGIGTHAWEDAGNKGIEPGYVVTNANFTFPTIVLPYGSSDGITPAGGTVVTVIGATTNYFNQTTTLPDPSMMTSPITTNVTTVSTTVYPGAKSEMTTNVTAVTTSTYPGSQPNLTTNCSTFVTVNSYPGPQTCLSTNFLGNTNTPAYPGAVAGLSTNVNVVTTDTNTIVNSTGTNCINYASSGSYPGAGKLCMTTNITVQTVGTNCINYVISAGYPGPGKLCLTTNGTTIITTTNCSAVTLHVTNSWPGNQYLYCGVTTNQFNSGQGGGQGQGGGTVYNYHPFTITTTTNYTYRYETSYSYNYQTNYSYTYETAYNYGWVTNYTYVYATNYTYTYPLYSYDYANQITYSYSQYTYTYPIYTYSYAVYNNPVYETNSYDHILYGGNNYYSTTTLSGSTIVIGPGTANLVLPNGLTVKSTDSLKIDSGSLTVYTSGDISISGNGVVNSSGYAGNFVIYGTDSCQNFTLNGNGSFTGVVIAPNAAGKMNGSGKDHDDFQGMLVLKSEVLNGNFEFHYDEALGHDGHLGNAGRWMAMSWREIH